MDVVVPKPQHTKGILSKPEIPAPIFGGFGVLPPIHLDHEPGLVTEEIRHIGTEWNLTPEFRAGKTAVPQRVPKLAFGIGQSRAQNASTTGRGRKCPLTRPPPHGLRDPPPPRRGG